MCKIRKSVYIFFHLVERGARRFDSSELKISHIKLEVSWHTDVGQTTPGNNRFRLTSNLFFWTFLSTSPNSCNMRVTSRILAIIWNFQFENLKILFYFRKEWRIPYMIEMFLELFVCHFWFTCTMEI